MPVDLGPATKVGKELQNMLNDALARQLQVSIQYMLQHIQVVGAKGVALAGKAFKDTAITEMKHAEEIAERLWYLGGVPTTNPSPITVGETLREMLELDVKAEEEAIDLYKRIIAQAVQEGDEATAHVFRGTLLDEEKHHDLFTTILEEI